MNRIRYRRSPHLLIEWRGAQTVVVDCNTMRGFPADEHVIRLLGSLAEWRSLAEVTRDWATVDGDLTADLARLARAGLVETGTDTPPGGTTTAGWSPFELAVQRMTNWGGTQSTHAPASRRGAHDRNVTGMRTPLPAPAPLEEASFAHVLAQRRTRRRFASRHMRLVEISTLLHHAARIVREGHDPAAGDYAFRPYAAAGARSELEIYVVANAVQGLPAGVHYYDPRAHELRAVQAAGDQRAHVVRSVHQAAGGLFSGDPPVILLITAVFMRVMEKYQNLGLSLIYKDVGCLFQTLYLVATAMDLAPCAIGGGQETANSRWLGLDPLVESQVGCFVVGPRHDDG